MSTKEQREWMTACASFGCLACYLDGKAGTYAEIHHIREGQGKGQRADDMDSFCLCPSHHRGLMHRPGRLGHIPSIHMDKRAFIAKYGTESDLLKKMRDLLGY